MDEIVELTPAEKKELQKLKQKAWYIQNRQRLLQKQKEYYRENDKDTAYNKYKKFYEDNYKLVEAIKNNFPST